MDKQRGREGDRPKIDSRNFYRFLEMSTLPESLKSCERACDLIRKKLSRYALTDETARRTIANADAAYAFAKENAPSIWVKALLRPNKVLTDAKTGEAMMVSEWGDKISSIEVTRAGNLIVGGFLTATSIIGGSVIILKHIMSRNIVADVVTAAQIVAGIVCYVAVYRETQQIKTIKALLRSAEKEAQGKSD